MLVPEDPISDALSSDVGCWGSAGGGWNIDLKAECTEEEIIRLNNLAIFSFGDEELQGVWYYCFDIQSYNKEIKEMNIVSFDQDDWGKLLKSNGICTTQGAFDKHIVSLVNQKMENLESW